MILTAIRDGIREYLPGKIWYWYVPLLLAAVWMFFSVLKFDPNSPVPLIILPAQSFNFGMHEIAHIATAFMPALLTALSGSASELLLGTALIIGAFATRCYFAAVICCLWFMLACQSVGIYMVDARAGRLNLVSLGGALSGSEDVIHDWEFIFGKLNLLQYDTLLGNALRGFGVIVGMAGLGFGAWLLVQMVGSKDAPRAMTVEEKALLHTHANIALGDKPTSDIAVQHVPPANMYPAPTKGRFAPTDEKPHGTQP